MSMKVNRIILLILMISLISVSLCCAVSEVYWTRKENTVDYTRELVGLPSIAIGNLSPAARNPGLEILCTGLYDVPGGYCDYFMLGVPPAEFKLGGNITVSDSK